MIFLSGSDLINNYELVKQKYAQSLLIGLTLAFCGGYIDAYTYVLREHSLVAGQTGNIVFLAVDIASKGLVLTETRFFTLVFFILGIFTISFLAKKLDSPYVKPLSLLPCILPYNNSFSTGNIKKGMLAWNGFFFSHNLADKHAAKLYLAITLAFALGALCSAELEKIWGIHTIWAITVILSTVMLRYLYLLHHEK